MRTTGILLPRALCAGVGLATFTDTQAGQARNDTYDEIDRPSLAMQEHAEGLEKVAATGDTQQLPPGTATGVIIGAEIAPADKVTKDTVLLGS